MVKITLDYRSIEEAVVALAKLGELTPPKISAAPLQEAAGNAGTPERSATTAAEPDKPKRTRRTKAEIAAAKIESAAPQEQRTANILAADVGIAPPVVAAASTGKLEDAQAAMESMFNAKGIQTAQALLQRFGVKRVRELKPEQFAEFVTDAGRAERGEYDPAA